MNAENNIYILPGDRIYVYQEQQKFIAFGATGGNTAGVAQNEIPFDAWRLNLAEAVAKAGGLGDLQADPGAVFLYRQEPRDVAQLLGANMMRFGGPLVPVIFQIDFRDPGGYFLATRLQMRNDDIIFVANAHSYEGTKILNYVSLMMSAISNTGTAVVAIPTANAAVHYHTLPGSVVTATP